MKIITNIDESHCTITLDGKLDTSTASFVQEKFDEIPANVSHITVDMEQLNYICSSGLRVLLKETKLMNNRGGDVEVINANEDIREVFKITGFNKILCVR